MRTLTQTLTLRTYEDGEELTIKRMDAKGNELDRRVITHDARETMEMIRAGMEAEPGYFVGAFHGGTNITELAVYHG